MAKAREEVDARLDMRAAGAKLERMQEKAILRVHERSPYGPDSEHSFFRDAAMAARVGGEPQAGNRLHVDRLLREKAATGKEERAVTTSTVGGIMPTLPLWVDQALMAAVRSTAPLFDALEKLPLPEQGTTVQFSKWTTGSSVGTQATESTAVTSVDPAIAFDNEPLSTFAGAVVFSFQIADRGVNADQQIAQDLGAAYAAKVESELWVGTGSGGRIRGLTQATPGTSVAAGGQTPANNIGAVHNCWQTLTMAFGAPPDILVVHPRRSAFWRQMILSGPQSGPQASVPQIAATLVESPAAPGNLGAGTEDWPHFIVRRAVPVATDPPQISFQPQQQGSLLITQCVLHGYLAFATSARPEGLGRITALTTPTFG